MKKSTLACILTAALGCMTLSSCSVGNTQSSTFDRYSLALDVSPAAFASPYAVALSLAPMLSQGGVVLQLDDVTLRPAKNYRYSSNLDDDLKAIVCDEMMKANLPKAFEQVEVAIYVAKFQGTIDGHSLVSVSAKVTDPETNKVYYSKSFNEDSVISADGYGPLVVELKNNFVKITRSMVEVFKTLNIVASTKKKK